MYEWEEDYSPASYNGITFYTDKVSRKGGRRLQVDDLPLKDRPKTKDLGKKSFLNNVNAYYIGTDYHKKRDRLLDELERGGVGDLILPTYDLVRVRLESYEINESKDEGGFCTISMEFVEAGEEANTGPEEDDIFTILEDAADAIDLSKSEFAKRFDVNGLPQSFIDSSIAVVKRFTKSIDNSYEFVRSQGSGISELNEKTSQLNDSINNLFSKPSELGDVITDTIRLANGTSDNSNNSATSLKGVVLNTSDVVEADSSVNTPNEIQEIVNNNELSKLQRRVSTFLMIQNIHDYSFSNKSEVMAQRDFLVSILDNERDYADIELYEKISTIKTRLINIMPAKITNIPNVVKFKAGKDETPIVFLYRTTGTIKDLDLFLDRNNLKGQVLLRPNESYEVEVD